VRPGRRGSRPRTRRRPAHEDATPALVIAVDRGRYRCLADLGTGDERAVTAMRARELGRKGVVVGDRVALVGDVSGDTDTLARIVRVDPRTTVLRRSADDGDPNERVIVANAAHHHYIPAKPSHRHRLIGTLAAGNGHKVASQDGFAWCRNMRRGYDQIHVDATYNNHGFNRMGHTVVPKVNPGACGRRRTRFHFISDAGTLERVYLDLSIADR